MPITVSVVVPTFNRAATIGPCLESILRQSAPAQEVIVVDDGSVDDTQAALAAFCDRIVVLRQENAGVSAARNAGIARSTAEWVTFLDSDDLWTPDRLAVLHRDLADAPAEIGVHAANSRLTGSDYDVDKFRMKGFSLPVDSALLVEHPLAYTISGFSSQATAVRRSWLARAGGFPLGMPFHEDTRLYCRLSQFGPWLMTAKIVAEVRRAKQAGPALSDEAKRRRVFSAQLLADAYHDLLDEFTMTPADRNRTRRALSGALFRLAAALDGEGRGKEARAALLGSARAHPEIKGWLKTAPPLLLGARGYGLILNGRQGFLRA